MPRFTRSMERRLGVLEEEYDVAPQEQGEEEGFFGKRGFLGNIRDYYQTDSWGDWWRRMFRRQQERGEEGGREESYTVYPEWGEGNIRTLREIMREREKTRRY